VTRVGVVLGAGGVIGQAYHSGVLAALAERTGFDPREAEVVVGTSAGSITGTLLRLGVSPRDLAAWTLRAPLAESAEPRRRDAALVPKMQPFRPAHLLRLPSPPTMPMIRRAVIRPWQFRPMAAGLALLAPGSNDIGGQLSALMELDDVAWPERALWIPTVRRMDGRRIVFGRPGTPPAPLHLAVAASCAVPGVFRPVRIGDHTYVDGGAHSPTNAGLLRHQGLDLVVIVSPMSGPPGRPGLYAASRRHAARRLRREVAALNAAGTRTLVFAPGEAEQRAMGDNLMSPRRVEATVHAALAGTKAALGRDVHELLAPTNH
jgi:NTE family protein